jgi:hypothetical protein
MKGPFFWLAFGGAATTTILACWAAWVFMIQPMDAAVKTTNALEKVFSAEFEITPRLSANAGVLFSQTARAENLVMARRTILIEQTLDMPLPDGSQPHVRAEFLAEAGISGREAIDINIRRGGREADVNLPKSKILTLEPASPPAVDSPAPTWEALPEHIRTRALRQLRLAARQRALDDGLLAESDQELRARISSLASKAGCRMVFPGTR